MKRIVIIFMSLIGLVLALTGCGEVESAPKTSVNTILDVSQYSRITTEELVSKLGDPISKDEWNYESPNGQSYATTSYNYEIDGYQVEFLVIENAVVRLNSYTSDNPDNKFEINEQKDVLSLVGITPRESLIVVEENPSVARYSSVSDVVGEVFALLDEKIVTEIKITYNLNYFN